MRQFYLAFPNCYALRSELSWTHYRLLMRVENENAREFYMQEAVKSQWSTRQHERQINSFFYERLLFSKNKELEIIQDKEVFIYGIKNQRTYKIIRPDRLSGRAFGLARHAQLQFRAAGDRRGLSGL